MKHLLSLTKEELVNHLWKTEPQIKKILVDSHNLHEARMKIFDYLNSLENHYYDIYSDKHFINLHIIEKNNAKECIRVVKNVIQTNNERLTNFSALKALFKLARSKAGALEEVDKGFLCEFINLFKGINGRSEVTDDIFILPSDKKEASMLRSSKLDEYAEYMNSYLNKYKKGTDPEVVERNKSLKKEILKYFRATKKDWNDYHWHFKHRIKDVETLTALVKLEDDELEGISLAEKNKIPFEITPYYLSLFNKAGRTADDKAIRAQVLPSKRYCENLIQNREKQIDMDFMGEQSTSPIEGITRRYPQIVILKPINVCPQICVYCQRNWELDPCSEARVGHEIIDNAVDWIENNINISEVLLTGGDPLLLGNDYIDSLLHKLSKIQHIERIRIGTRVLVTVPFRINDRFIEIIRKYHQYGKREICIVSHFEHSTEITPDVIEAVKNIRTAGISIYNQQVFTYYNSLKYETAALRRNLKLMGVDPYYTFNTKGKEETIDFRVPIARIEQERKEEARFLQGIVRTDEPVFNVPMLGKSHLRSWQNHEIIMILKTGQRIYRFFPWESKVTMVPDYLYTDVSIYDYLERLNKDSEDVNEYRSIWYYF